MSDPVRVRIPILEQSAVLLQDALTGPSRALLPEERRLLLNIFGQSVNCDLVRLAPTSIGQQGRPYTLANTIRIPRGTTLDSATLVHEMTHVWQYQTHGTGYISSSALHQLVQGQAAYAVTIVPGQSIYRYEAEQQAMIVQKYFQNSPAGWATDPDVMRMLGEVRAARPMTREAIYNETWNGPNRPDMFSQPPGTNQPSGGTVPIIRIEF